MFHLEAKKKPCKFMTYRVLLCFHRWYHSDLNQGLTDFQSVALPAELWYHFQWGGKCKIKITDQQ